MNKVQEAILLAARSHATQMYGKVPYIHHLAAVVNNLYEYGYDDEDLIAAGWLHDTIEDTSTPLRQVASTINQKVADLIWAVTGVGKNRKERMADTMKKITGNRKATILKMADRLANIENCVKNNPPLLEMYRKEMPHYLNLFYATDPKMTARMVRLLDE